MSNLNNLRTEKAYSILELNNAVRDLIRSEFPNYIWVCGEIQDLRERLHINLNLVQKDPKSDQTLAQVSAVIFANAKQHIFKRIKDAGSNFEFRKDIEVKFLCKVDLYAKTGKFSLTVVDIDPVYTIGKVALNRQKIIDELKKKGLLEKNKRQEISQIPLKIGLITAGGSAAYHDFTNELSLSGYGFKIKFFDAHMQGQKVERDISRALKYFNQLKSNELDLIVITRGGGSTADLGWFDNKKIAQTIAESKFPVLTGLGHEINTTIADLVAHTFLKTPTKAAQFIVEKVDRAKEKLEELSHDIIDQVNLIIDNSSKLLGTKILKIDSFLAEYFRDHLENLVKKRTFIFNSVLNFTKTSQDKIEHTLLTVKNYLKIKFQNLKKDLKYFDDKVSFLNPRNILKRGYSISFKGLRAIKSVRQVEKEDIIRTTFFDGEIKSIVKDLKGASDG